MTTAIKAIATAAVHARASPEKLDLVATCAGLGSHWLRGFDVCSAVASLSVGLCSTIRLASANSAQLCEAEQHML